MSAGLASLLLAAVAPQVTVAAQPQGTIDRVCPISLNDEVERKEILGVIDQFVAAIAASDAEALAAITFPGATMTDFGKRDGRAPVKSLPVAEWSVGVTTANGPFSQRLHDASARPCGPDASAIATYALVRDGKPLHCRADWINLARTERGWKIKGFIYEETSLHTHCPR